jgi:hypothetical protein
MLYEGFMTLTHDEYTYEKAVVAIFKRCRKIPEWSQVGEEKLKSIKCIDGKHFDKSIQSLLGKYGMTSMAQIIRNSIDTGDDYTPGGNAKQDLMMTKIESPKLFNGNYKESKQLKELKAELSK